MKRLQGRLRWSLVGLAALAVSATAVGAPAAKTVTVLGTVQAVSPASIRVSGTTCAIAPANPRMMMPAIIRDVAAGDSVLMTCTRAAGRLVLAKLVERPAGAVVVAGTVRAVNSQSITIRGVTCTFSVTSTTNPRAMMPTIIRGDQALMACLREQGQPALTAMVELRPHPGQTIVVAGPVTNVSRGSLTVAGITCLVPPNRTKPVLGMPAIIKDVAIGESVLMACTQAGGALKLTGVADAER